MDLYIRFIYDAKIWKKMKYVEKKNQKYVEVHPKVCVCVCV